MGKNEGELAQPVQGELRKKPGLSSPSCRNVFRILGGIHGQMPTLFHVCKPRDSLPQPCLYPGCFAQWAELHQVFLTGPQFLRGPSKRLVPRLCSTTWSHPSLCPGTTHISPVSEKRGKEEMAGRV